MVKVYHAKPIIQEHVRYLPPKTTGYLITPEAEVIKSKKIMSEPLPLGVMSQARSQRGTYQTLQGSNFNLEINILDSQSQKPVRSVEVITGTTKGFTDRVGRWFKVLPAGLNAINISGNGFVEKGSYSPEAVTFPPVAFDVDLDEDAIFTIYVPEGSIVQGERHELNNPHGPQRDISLFVKDNIEILALIGASGLTAYWLGTRSKK